MKIDRVIGIIGGAFILAGIGAMHCSCLQRRNGIKMQISVWDPEQTYPV